MKQITQFFLEGDSSTLSAYFTYKGSRAMCTKILAKAKLTQRWKDVVKYMCK